MSSIGDAVTTGQGDSSRDAFRINYVAYQNQRMTTVEGSLHSDAAGKSAAHHSAADKDSMLDASDVMNVLWFFFLCCCALFLLTASLLTLRNMVRRLLRQ